jgi:hypothetical protein
MKTKSINASLIEKLLSGLFVIMISFVATTSFTHAAGSTYGILELASADIESSNCNYVGDVWGTSGWGKSTLTVWKHKAEHKAMKMAKELNATHVYWEGHSAGDYGYTPRAHGKAYRCDGSGNVASADKDVKSSATKRLN